MPRQKLSEFRAKNLLYAALKQDYSGWEFDSEDPNWRQKAAQLDDQQRYVVKIDQAEKGRFKKGLVKLDRDRQQLLADIEAMFSAGYRFVLVEPYRQHDQTEERYLAVERTREGLKVSFTEAGGVDVEEQGEQMTTFFYGRDTGNVSLPPAALDAIVEAFEGNYFSFLEINPLLIQGGKLVLLDAAAEVDSEAQFFEDNWGPSDVRRARSRAPLPEESAVQELAAQSQASFSLEVLNPDGSIFLLLSGGGASVVVADEVFNLGFGEQLANYGEYSGNPNFEETRIYTEQIASLVVKSKAPRKVLIIGGGVANFTDVRVTFNGVIAALKSYQGPLKGQGVKVYVRRGGPHEREGLAAIKTYLEEQGIAGQVAGPELLLSDIVGQAVKEAGV